MYVIERKIPSKIIVLDAINRRIEPNEMIASLLKRAQIGYQGELKVDRIWNEIELPQNSLLLHNYETNNHQIDTLFACPHFILILEIKNISGYIWYEAEKHQFLRKKKTGEKEIESFQSPFEQVIRHAEFIEQVIAHLGLVIPVHKAVVIAEPSTIIGEKPGEIPIFHAIGLRTEVKKLLLKYSKTTLPTIHYEMLKQEFLNLHKSTDYTPKFEIPPIRKGAICECGRIMHYKWGKFICLCGIESKDALLQGLHDYRVLYNEWITNKEFREFFYIKNADLVNKLLLRMKLYHEGSNRGRRYLIPRKIWKDY